MATRLPTSGRNASADAVVDLVDAGAGAGTLKIYTGTQPASANDVASGTLLVTLTLSDPAFGAAASGVAALSGTPSASASDTGTAGWFRVEDSDGNTVFDGDVTATSGGGDIELDNTSISSGQTVTISSGSYTQPASE